MTVNYFNPLTDYMQLARVIYSENPLIDTDLWTVTINQSTSKMS